MQQQPTQAFVAVSWIALLVGIAGYLVGLYNAQIDLSEKGFYLTVLLYGLFAVVSVQKSVRDRQENIAVTDLYYGLCWASTLIAILLLVVGLWNATMLLSEKGFYGFAFLLALFGIVTVQKNVRDRQASRQQ
jgi:uncharacterized membrane protein YiaA